MAEKKERKAFVKANFNASGYLTDTLLLTTRQVKYFSNTMIIIYDY